MEGLAKVFKGTATREGAASAVDLQECVALCEHAERWWPPAKGHVEVRLRYKHEGTHPTRVTRRAFMVQVCGPSTSGNPPLSMMVVNTKGRWPIGDICKAIDDWFAMKPDKALGAPPDLHTVSFAPPTPEDS